MFRIHLARLMTLGAAFLLVGCSSSGRGGGLCHNNCGEERQGLFSRFRTASSTGPVMVPGGECCNQTVSGPFLPPAGGIPATVLPAPQPGGVPPLPSGGGIPPIQDAPQKQYDYNKMNSRPGIKTTNDGRVVKEGI